MAPTGGKQTDISDLARPGLFARARQAATYFISGQSSWMSAGQPMVPSVPPGTEPRRRDFPVGVNQQTRPRAEEPITFQTLRNLSRSCDLLRVVIETRKDQLEAMDWQIRARADSKAKANDPRIAAVQAFLRSPDKQTDWAGWLRMILEDMFVLDAVAIYKRRDKKGRLYSLDLLDAASVSIKIDDTGRRPIPPDTAYQQVIKGVPIFDFTSDELIYWMRNPRTDRQYGYSPVEQIIVTINIALRRTASQLAYYTDGNVNAGIFWMPKDWTVEQIAAMNEYWEAEHGGNAQNKAKAKFLQGDKDSFQQIIQPPMKDEFDEWLARVICANFSISPTPFIKQMNRSTADTAHDTALEEGLAPLQKAIKSVIDQIIAEEFDGADLEFAWVDDREIDPEVASKIQSTKVTSGILTINEARAQDGLDPYADGVGDTPGIITAVGFVPLPTPALLDAQHDAALAGTAPDDEADEPEDDEGGAASKALAKKYSNPLDRTAAKAAIAAIHKRVQTAFDHAAHHVATQLRGIALSKADDPEAEAKRKAKAQEIADQLNLFDLRDIKAISGSLGDVATDAAASTLDDIGVTLDTAMFGQVSQKSVAWANEHAADLVTQITASTRDMLRATITEGLKETDIHGVADRIAASYGFSEERALLIADTETAFANGQGALTGYQHAKSLGIKLKKQWLDDPLACPVCVANALAGPIDLDELFPSGHMTTPAHPRCSCSSIAVIED